MSDIIHLLSDAVANQIAAGEVIQRPASVIKELVENSIDAGANDIKIIIKDAGRTLIQVIDNGKGMSETDARLSFERHATSKIQSAQDLFSLHTMGFRGEALASIASVAQVELRTRRAEDELGTLIQIAGSSVEKQESLSCSCGTNFQIKNLFFNVPARRKFLKSNATEFSHIEREFFRIALVYPQINFEFWNNDQECYILRQCNYRERIVNLFGKGINPQLFNINVDSTIVKIFGFVGKPETAKRQNDKQYFFVNGRYMRHPYFHKAVMQAYDRMIQPNTSPDYFIYFEIDPECIDVNIHPTKTEIKFENESAVWPLIMAGVKEALGKFNAIPSIDFEQEGAPELPPFSPHAEIHIPNIKTDPSYNPFAGQQTYRRNTDENWEALYKGFETDKQEQFSHSENVMEFSSKIFDDEETNDEPQLNMDGEENRLQYVQFKNKYILTAVKSGLMCIDQHRAHIRILYDQYMNNISERKGYTQKLLYPEILELLESESMILDEILENLKYLGFDIELFGKNTYSINGIPANNDNINAKDFVMAMINSAKEANPSIQNELVEKVTLSLANLSAVPYGRILKNEEMMELVNNLLSRPEPKFTPDNKIIFSIFQTEEFDKRFK